MVRPAGQSGRPLFGAVQACQSNRAPPEYCARSQFPGHGSPLQQSQCRRSGPWYLLTEGSMISASQCFKAVRVPISSLSMSDEYFTTSAASMAASLRSMRDYETIEYGKSATTLQYIHDWRLRPAGRRINRLLGANRLRPHKNDISSPRIINAYNVTTEVTSTG